MDFNKLNKVTGKSDLEGYDNNTLLQKLNSLQAELDINTQYLEKAKNVIDLAPLGITNVDRDGHYIFVNNAWCEMCGYSKEELLTMTFWQLGRDDFNQKNLENINRLYNGEIEQFTMDKIYYRKDGTPFWGNIVTSFVQDDKDGPGYLLTMIRDIDQQKKGEERLKNRLSFREFADGHSLIDMLQYLLEKGEQITTSKLGFFYFFEPDQKTISMQIWSKNSTALYHLPKITGTNDPFNKAEMWSESARQKKAVIQNDFSKFSKSEDMPVGVPIVVRVFTIPIIRGNQIKAIIGVGNKGTDYDQNDVLTLFELIDAIWDVIERKRSEETLVKLTRAVEENPVSIVITNKAAEIEYVNPKFCEVTGYLAEELFGKNPRILKSGTQPEQFYKDMWKTLAEGNVWHGEICNKKKNGELYWESATISPLKKDGAITHYVGVKEDITTKKQIEAELKNLNEELEKRVEERTHQLKLEITDRLKAERALGASESRFGVLFKNTLVGISFTDVNGNYLECNQAYSNIVGYTQEELNKLNFRDIALAEDMKPEDNLLQNLYNKTIDSFMAEMRIHTKNRGVIWVELIVSAVFDLDGNLINLIGMITDINQRKNHEKALFEEHELLAQRVSERTAELRAANSELERALRVRDEFLATMSHELRSPLNSILVLTEIMAEGVYGSVNDEQRKSLNEINESGRHLLELINDILDFSKIEAGKLSLDVKTVWIADVCPASIRLIREQANKKRLTIESHLDPNVVTLEADERRLKQILVNLLSNAVKFTPSGGKIWLEVNGDKSRNEIYFTVGDTGIGITKEDLPRLFKPFTQLDSGLDRQQGGTGLGLVLVQKMVEMHNGKISINTEPGMGSLFTVTLPWVENNEPASIIEDKIETMVPENISPINKNHPILLVDDSELVLITISTFLKNKGYRINLARNGLEAIEAAKKEIPGLILMDVQMPLMDGLEAIRKMRQDPELANLNIVVMSALAMHGDRETCLEAGATDYLSKPVSLKQIISTIEKYLL